MVKESQKLLEMQSMYPQPSTIITIITITTITTICRRINQTSNWTFKRMAYDGLKSYHKSRKIEIEINENLYYKTTIQQNPTIFALGAIGWRTAILSHDLAWGKSRIGGNRTWNTTVCFLIGDSVTINSKRYWQCRLCWRFNKASYSTPPNPPFDRTWSNRGSIW